MPSLELKIVDILESKLLAIRSPSQGDLYDEHGRDALLKKVQTFMQENRPIELLLPAFPCKSPNLKKVCGKLPDGGELYALEYLNGICREISFLYEHGCELVVWSDGRVFGDLISVSEADIATYEHLLKYYSMTMTHIQWDSMNNYVRTGNGESLVKRYGTPTFAFDQWLLESENNREQFVHLRKFMENDLGNSPKYKDLSRRQLKNEMGLIAEQMIRRNEALTNLLKQHYPKHIRLSIHQHPNDGEKFTIRFFKNSGAHSVLRTPWQNVLVINVEGGLDLMPHQKLNLESQHVPIMFKNQIWCFVQLPRDTAVPVASTMKLSLLGDSPRFGLSIDLSKKIDVFQLDVAWMKMLLEKFGLVVLRRCQNSLDKDNYSQFCEQFSPPVMWKFGSLLSIKPELTPDSSHSSRDSMPLHFDLSFPPEYLFKTGSYNDYVPQYFMLYSVKAPPEHGNGKTTFVNGRLLLESLREKDILHWKTIDTSSSMALSYYGGKTYIYPMIMSHPKTNENIFRYLEISNNVIQPVESKCLINSVEMDTETFQKFNSIMKKKMRDPKWYMEHTWNDDDLVIVENHLLLHGRTAITEETERELWRIQVY
ncbi:unnamed protein product [Didymodactylos carnosus]|uniref:TauD/TfdA-like domain-containing protein n=1 Tax=Didymodactylos carnosus TaxID=1234261 RepID=A0A8S2GQ32_9BILA|nr:unnamed protein product [Didymodactylos carnosus]CAF3544105.1 unnamed protein product [Didymodactylos carnosus]CAF4478210.1 unnamed protein product [Didymodactylos carnosus]